MTGPIATTAKGVATHEAILDRAYEMACAGGLEGLSIAPLAQAVGMSKSGVFAHFGSREELQLAVLDSAAQRFGTSVLGAALARPRGAQRLRAIMYNWFDWVRSSHGGCVLLGAATEFDDREGPVRDRALANDRRWRAELGRAIRQAIDAGDLREGDCDQYVFELYGIALAVHHDAGFYGFDTAQRRGTEAVERWFALHSVVAAGAGQPASPEPT